MRRKGEGGKVEERVISGEPMFMLNAPIGIPLSTFRKMQIYLYKNSFYTKM